MRAPTASTSCAAAVVAALASLLSPSPASADDGAKPALIKPQLVVVAPQLASTDVDDRAVAVVVAHLRALDLEIQIVRIEAGALDAAGLRDAAKKVLEAGSARGALWIDAGREDDVGLYAVPREGGELFGRRVTAARGKTATALESLAGIASAAGEELAQGRSTGLPKVDVPAMTVAPPAEPPADNAAKSDPVEVAPPAPREERVKDRPLITGDAADVPRGPTPWPMLAFSASYVGGTFGDGVPWQNGASLRASFAPMRGLYLGAGYDVVAPSRATVGPAAVDLTRHPIFAGGGYRLVLGSRFDLQLGARATVDVAQQDLRLVGAPHGGGNHPGDNGGPGGGGGGFAPPPFSMTSVVVSAAPMAEAFFLVTDQLRMNAMIGVDFAFASSLVSASNTPRGAPDPTAAGLSPDPIRFMAGLGFEYGVVLPSSRKNVQTASR